MAQWPGACLPSPPDREDFASLLGTNRTSGRQEPFCGAIVRRPLIRARIANGCTGPRRSNNVPVLHLVDGKRGNIAAASLAIHRDVPLIRTFQKYGVTTRGLPPPSCPRIGVCRAAHTRFTGYGFESRPPRHRRGGTPLAAARSKCGEVDVCERQQGPCHISQPEQGREARVKERIHRRGTKTHGSTRPSCAA